MTGKLELYKMHTAVELKKNKKGSESMMMSTPSWHLKMTSTHMRTVVFVTTHGGHCHKNAEKEMKQLSKCT